MNVLRTWILVAQMVVLLTALGCGGGAPKHPSAKLAGNVSIDKKPVATGSVTFMPEAGNAGQPVTATIKDGKYDAIAVPQGKVKAMISATEPTGEMDNSRTPAIPIVKNIVPESARAGIDLNVSADNPQQHFELTSP